MKYGILSIGGLCVSVLLVVAALTPVVSAQVAKPSEERIEQYKRLAYKQLQITTKYDEQTMDKITGIIDQFLSRSINGNWEPGIFIVLFLALMSAVFEAIGNGQYAPGMIFGAFILYLVLVWLIIFGGSTSPSP